MNLEALRGQARAVATRMESRITTAIEANRELTAEESAANDADEKELADLKVEITAAEAGGTVEKPADPVDPAKAAADAERARILALADLCPSSVLATPLRQGTGCPTSVSPCANVRVTPAQIGTYLSPLFQASDADLAAIAALASSSVTRATTTYGLNFLTVPDAPTARSWLALGSNATDSVARAPAARAINTAAPLTGGGDLTADRTIGITAASSANAGSMSAADKAKLDGVSAGASVSSVACTASGGLGCSVTGSTGAASITITPAANVSAIAGLNTAADQCIYWTGSALASLYGCPAYGRSLVGSTSASAAQATLGLGTAALAPTGTSGHTVGFLDGSNIYSGAMTFSQTITGSVTGNAGTATVLQTGRKVNGVTFNGSTDITINAVDSTARLAAASNLSDVASPATARQNIGAAGSGANTDITGFTNNLRIYGRLWNSPPSSAGTAPEAPTLGSPLATSPLLLSDYTGNYGLAFGVGTSSGNTWIQAQRFDSGTSAYNLVIQPAGGNVGISTASPAAKLDVTGSANVSAALSVGGTITTSAGAIALYVRAGVTGGPLAITEGDNNTAYVTGFTPGTGYSPLTIRASAITLNPTGGTTQFNGALTGGSLTLTTPVGVASGGTGDTGTAWSTYTPSVTASSGSFASSGVTAYGRYKRIGKTVFVRISIVIASSGNGSAAGFITATLPYASADAGSVQYQQILAGKETNSVGFGVAGNIGNNSSSMNISRSYDGSYPGGNSYTLNLSGSYEAS